LGFAHVYTPLIFVYRPPPNFKFLEITLEGLQHRARLERIPRFRPLYRLHPVAKLLLIIFGLSNWTTIDMGKLKLAIAYTNTQLNNCLGESHYTVMFE